MIFRSSGQPRLASALVLTLVLLLVIACGSAAAPTPLPTSTPVVEEVVKEVVKEVEVEKEVVREILVTVIPTATPIPAAPSSPGKAKVERLVYAVGEVAETNRHWTVSGPAYYQFDPNLEGLIDHKATEFGFIPRLADRWEASPDAKSWTFYLHKGVPFHFGWGEFTAADVVDAHRRITSEESLATTANFWKSAENIEVVSDHEITFHMDGPATTLDAIASRGFGGGDMVMLSKAQIDAEGYEGIDRKPAGTGPYQYLDRKPGEGISFERIPGEHWRGERPEFQELEIRWVREDATRLAMILVGEAHMVDLSRELQLEAINRGMKNVSSRVKVNWLTLFLGGQYYTSGDASYDPSVPWANPATGKLVRQAMNKAIDRQELLDFVLRGNGELMRVTGFHPSLDGWNPDWEREWDDLYGYDPDRARELLVEAGYGPDNPVEVKMLNYSSAGEPETPVMVEAMINYWEPVGIKVTIEDSEWGRVRAQYNAHEAQCCAWGNVINSRQTIDQVRLMVERLASFEDDYMVEQYGKLRNAVDPKEIDRLSREAGDHYYHEFADIPLFWFALEVTVNPEVVEDWVFPGTANLKTSHFNLVKAAQ